MEKLVPVDHTRAGTVFVGESQVDLETWEGSALGEHFRLPEKAFRVLEALLEQPGQVVTREELQERLWPDGTVVDFDNNLNSAVATLRTTLGDSAKAPKIIETLPRLGYRLVCDVRFSEPEPAPADGRSSDARPEPPVTGLARRPFPVVAVTGLALALLLTALTLSVTSSFETDPQAPATSVFQPASETKVDLPSNELARAAWHRGLYLQARATTADRPKAVEAFHQIVRLEPAFAPAHTKLAETLADMSFFGGLELREGLSRARSSANRALLLDSSSASALRVRSLANLHLDWDFPAAARDLESALRLDPLDAKTYLAAATFLSALGDNNSAVLAAQRAVELDPASSLLKADLGYFLIAAGRYVETVAICDELLLIEPNSIAALHHRSIATERLGQFEESVADAMQIMELRGAEPTEVEALGQRDPASALTIFRRWQLAQVQSREHSSAFHVALRHAWLDQAAEALSLLEGSFVQQEPLLLYLHGYSEFDSLRQNPRFARLVEGVRARSLQQGEAADLVTNVAKLL